MGSILVLLTLPPPGVCVILALDPILDVTFFVLGLGLFTPVLELGLDDEDWDESGELKKMTSK